jgi:tape measure domain-containing protein
MDQAARRIEHRFAQTERRVNRSFNNMATAGVAAFAALAAARMAGQVVGDLIRVSDTYQGLQNQVNSATEAVGRSLATMEEIAGVARSSRTSLEGTTMLYTRLARATAHLNVSQEDTLRMTELVGMSFAASGATIQEQRSSILQLSQALQSGFLQGDELRSLREGAPEIARAIAAEMNVGIGALKELGAQG